jgi:hypothetical protein
MKKLFVFAVAFISFTGFTFSGKYDLKPNKPTASVTVAQAVETFSYFRTHRQAKNVVLSWGVTSISGVTGFVIERSYDGEFFEAINQVSSNTDLKYSWKDLSVFAGYIYYRVGIVMPDGRISSYSPVDVVRIVSHG